MKLEIQIKPLTESVNNCGFVAVGGGMEKINIPVQQLLQIK